MIFNIEQMRQTILGKINWSKCIPCGATGYENWDEDGHDIQSGVSGDPNRVTGTCENCDGLGFVVIAE